MHVNFAKPILYGIFASVILLGIYFAVLTLVSGWTFTLSQFLGFWYFIVNLSAGFGIQVGLYSYLRNLIKEDHGKMLGVTGTTSTVAMISCCAHYLANLLPILGTAGLVAIVAQFQVELFWVGLLFNFGGILFMIQRIYQFKKI